MVTQQDAAQKFDNAVDEINKKSKLNGEPADQNADPPAEPPVPKEKTKVELAKAAAQKAHKAYDSFAQSAKATDENTEHNPCSWLPKTPSTLIRSPLGLGTT